MKLKVLGVITARGGSKSIPQKNIKLMLGKPLLAHTIEAAKKSGVFDRLIISTDDERIAEVAREYGCEVPFIRPAELAQDDTPHLPVMQHAVAWLRDNQNYLPDYVMILQPTSPLRQHFHIRESVELAGSSKADSVVGVAKLPEQFNPNRSLFVADGEGFLKLFSGRPLYERHYQRQLASDTYLNNASIYLFKPDLLFDEENPNLFGEKTLPYVMDEKYSVDINTEEDWLAAERKLKQILEETNNSGLTGLSQVRGETEDSARPA